MSTTNPLEKARLRRERQKGSSGMLLATILTAALVVAAGTAGGIGVADTLDPVRIFELDNVFDTAAVEPAFFWLIFVGVFGSALTGAIYGSVGRRFTGAERAPVPGAVTLALIGAAAGFAGRAWLWRQPSEEGFRPDTTVEGQEAWSAGDWIFFHAGIWVPIALVLLAVLGTAFRLRVQRGRIRLSAHVDELERSGVRVEGRVEAVKGTPTAEVRQFLATVTTTFLDGNGTQRWVVKPGPFTVDTLPAVGDTALVVYDPLEVADEKRILVAHGTPELVERALAGGPLPRPEVL
ncbi:MAG: hypothetical protein ABW040_04570 [Microbacteriaceae bacterium]